MILESVNDYRAACLNDDVGYVIILCRADGRVGVIGLRYGYLVWGGDATMQQRILMAAMAPWRGGGRSLLAVAFGSFWIGGGGRRIFMPISTMVLCRKIFASLEATCTTPTKELVRFPPKI